jgi:hypothetical protein
MDLLWIPYGFPMDYDFLIDFLRISSGFPIDFLMDL